MRFVRARTIGAVAALCLAGSVIAVTSAPVGAQGGIICNGDDDLHGGKGDDTISGGEGEDFLRGGSSELDTCFDPNAGTFGRACEIHTSNVDNRPAIR